MGIKQDALWTPGANQLIEIRGTVDNRTAFWMVNVGEFGWHSKLQSDHEFQIRGRIIAAQFLDAIDARVATQREHINRLLEHLKHDCPKLARNEACPHVELEVNP